MGVSQREWTGGAAFLSTAVDQTITYAAHRLLTLHQPLAREFDRGQISRVAPVNGGPVLPHLLQEGWVPVRETPMGGGTSQLAHSLILLERDEKPVKAVRAARAKAGANAG